jgi:hypothetical protein
MDAVVGVMVGGAALVLLLARLGSKRRPVVVDERPGAHPPPPRREARGAIWLLIGPTAEQEAAEHRAKLLKEAASSSTEVYAAACASDLRVPDGRVKAAMLTRRVAWNPRLGDIRDPAAHERAVDFLLGLRFSIDSNGELRGRPTLRPSISPEEKVVSYSISWSEVDTREVLAVAEQLDSMVTYIVPALPELISLVDRLVRLGHESGGRFLEARAACREIGTEAHRVAGEPGMVYVCETLGRRMPGCAREVEVCWGGIGEWQS